MQHIHKKCGFQYFSKGLVEIIRISVIHGGVLLSFIYYQQYKLGDLQYPGICFYYCFILVELAQAAGDVCDWCVILSLHENHSVKLLNICFFTNLKYVKTPV